MRKSVFMMPANKKAFDLMGDDLMELSTRNESLKNKKGSYDEERLEEIKTNLLKQNNDEKRASLFMPRMGKQTKTQNDGLY